MNGSLDHAHRAAVVEHRLTRLATGTTVAAGLAMTLFIYAPVLLLAILSISGEPLTGTPGAFTLAWYASLFSDTGWIDPMILSVAIALAVAALCAVTATIVARETPRLVRGRGALMVLFLLPIVIPGIVLGIQQFTTYRSFLQIRPGVWSLILTHFIWAFPFALLSLLVVTLRFDRSLVDAAADLGASRWRAFWDVERPLLMPGILAAAMFGFLLSLTELSRSIFIRGGAMTLPVYFWNEAAGHTTHIPLIYCLNTLVALVSIGLSALSVLLLSRVATRGGRA